MLPQLLKVKEVAQRLNISPSRTFILIRTGAIPSVRLGERCVRVREEDLERFISSSTSEGSNALLNAKFAAETTNLRRTIANNKEYEVTNG